MSARKIGDLLDSLGVELDYEDEDMIPDVIVVAKVIDEDGNVSVGIGSSEALTWIDQIGLLTAATDIARQGYMHRDDGGI